MISQSLQGKRFAEGIQEFRGKRTELRSQWADRFCPNRGCEKKQAARVQILPADDSEARRAGAGDSHIERWTAERRRKESWPLNGA